MPKIVHFEIPVDDPGRAIAFYRGALGWEVSQFGQDYWLVKAGAEDEPGADGALTTRGELHRSPILIAGVLDLDDVLGRVQQGGGTVLQGKGPIPGVGWAAYVRDPEGNTIGLFQPDTTVGPAQ